MNSMDILEFSVIWATGAAWGQGQGNLATAYVDVISGQVEVGPWTDCKQCGVLAPAVPLFDDTRVH